MSAFYSVCMSNVVMIDFSVLSLSQLIIFCPKISNRVNKNKWIKPEMYFYLGYRLANVMHTFIPWERQTW